MIRRVMIPPNDFALTDKAGLPLASGERSRFFTHFALIICEQMPQMTDRETELAASIAAKVRALKPEDNEIDLDQMEIEYLRAKMTAIRREGKMVGTGWFHLMHPLNSADPAPRLVMPGGGSTAN